MIARKIILASLLLSASICKANGNDPEFKLADVLPTGKVEIEFVEVAMSERGTELSQKVQLAVSSKREWMLEYISNTAKPGEPLPYHENFGVTETEYEEFLNESRRMKVRSTGVRWRCQFSVEDGLFKIAPLERRSPSLRSIAINIHSDDAMASGIELGKGLWRVHADADSAIGPWRGFVWKIERGNILDGKQFLLTELDVLHRLDSSKVLIRHKFQEGSHRKNNKSFEFMFQFDAPALESQ